MKQFLRILFLFCMAGIGCSSPHQSSESNPLLVGYGLIDEGRDEEAIEHFQSLVESHPDSEEYRRGLSSAYALKGGFRIQNLVGPMKEIGKADEMKEEFQKVFGEAMKIRGDAKGFENFIVFEVELLVFMKKFSSVPSVSADQVKDLRASISILHSLKSVTPGDYLYMAVLESLILKYNLITPMQIQSCDLSILEFQKRVRNAAGQFGKILFLLGQAQPSQGAEYEKQQIAIQETSAATSVLTKSSLLTLSLMQYVSDSKMPIRIFIPPPGCQI